MIKFLSGLWRSYMDGAERNHFPFSKYGFLGERLNDPIYNCEFYRDNGCSHVDGLGCDMENCGIRKDFEGVRDED